MGRTLVRGDFRVEYQGRLLKHSIFTTRPLTWPRCRTYARRFHRVAADPGKEVKAAGEKTSAPSPPPPEEKKVEDAEAPAPSAPPAMEEVEDNGAPDPSPPAAVEGEDVPVRGLLHGGIFSRWVIPFDTSTPLLDEIIIVSVEPPVCSSMLIRNRSLPE